ncbi:MAG: hypothetical protein KC776_05735 [Myxococcales bacterium]|nr:hypothetical protein [Myxococcales bacterium]
MKRPFFAVLALSTLLVACDKKENLEKEQGAAPPPVQSSKPGVCAGGGGMVKDSHSAAFFPRTAASYCIDPNGEVRAFGKDAPASLDKVCTELFDGECEVYKSFGLERVVTLRYVDGAGSPGAVNVNLSRFASKDGAYGFYTKRVIADGDPLEVAPAKLEAGGAAAMGTGIAYVWRGPFVAELSYTNELESPDQLKATSAKVIPPIAQKIGEQLSGDKEAPSAVAALATDKRVPMGVSFEAKDLLDVSGVGPGALGFYKDGDKRWRELSLVRDDEAAAKDVLKTLGKLEGAKTVKGVTFDAVRFTRQADESSPKVAWIVGRKGNAVVGIGDEELVLSADQSAEAAAKVSLSESEKLDHLKALVGGS